MFTTFCDLHSKDDEFYAEAHAILGFIGKRRTYYFLARVFVAYVQMVTLICSLNEQFVYSTVLYKNILVNFDNYCTWHGAVVFLT